MREMSNLMKYFLKKKKDCIWGSMPFIQKNGYILGFAVMIIWINSNKFDFICKSSLVSLGWHIAKMSKMSGETMTNFFLLKDFWQSQSNLFCHVTFTTNVYCSVIRYSEHCISAITNNHSGICGFLRRSSIQNKQVRILSIMKL